MCQANRAERESNLSVDHHRPTDSAWEVRQVRLRNPFENQATAIAGGGVGAAVSIPPRVLACVNIRRHDAHYCQHHRFCGAGGLRVASW